MASEPQPPSARPAATFALSCWALLLFLVWSNSFVAIGWLLGSEEHPAAFDWVGLTVARFLPAALLASVWCFGFRRRASLALLRAHPVRALACGLLGVPAYNFSLYYGQQGGVPAPIASLTTTLAPLFIMLLSAAVLREAITRRRALGFAVALAGMVVVASAKGQVGGTDYGLLVAVTALAPLSWSLYTVVSKPVARLGSPVTWTYLTIVVGTLPLLAVLPWRGGPELLRLDLAGWLPVLYLSVACTVLGFAVWNWLLQHLPASSVGFTVFLNPPLTTASKVALALLFPAAFTFQVRTGEWVGGAIVLTGLALALTRSRRPPDPGPVAAARIEAPRRSDVA